MFTFAHCHIGDVNLGC